MGRWVRSRRVFGGGALVVWRVRSSIKPIDPDEETGPDPVFYPTTVIRQFPHQAQTVYEDDRDPVLYDQYGDPLERWRPVLGFRPPDED